MSKRLPNLAPPFAKTRKKIADNLARFSTNLHCRKNFGWGLQFYLC